MKVMIDGKEVECQESVKIIHDDQIIGVEWKASTERKGWEQEVELNGEIHIQCTHEGIIVDAVDPKTGEVVSSMWQDIDDLVEMTH